ncbi:MAG TPA: hypothetical protein VN048_12560 [Verrucomicrobiae bacterium]|jgi:hypothetical protein|nr:hypothetical protein [Verrucomicrobiae bacterium]
MNQLNRVVTRFRFVSRALRLMPIVAVLALLTGCLPIPHTTDRSGEVTGRVVDAHTREPIQGAEIFLVEKPHHPTYTDTNGHFDMKATRNFHWAYAPPEGDWPQGKGDIITVSYPNYLPKDISPNMVGSIDVGDILLNPKPPNTH